MNEFLFQCLVIGRRVHCGFFGNECMNLIQCLVISAHGFGGYTFGQLLVPQSRISKQDTPFLQTGNAGKICKILYRHSNICFRLNMQDKRLAHLCASLIIWSTTNVSAIIVHKTSQKLNPRPIHWISTGMDWACQMSRTYSDMVRSLEKYPIQAVLRMDIFVQRFGSR